VAGTIKEEVPVWQKVLLDHKNFELHFCLKYSNLKIFFQFDCLPTDKVVRYNKQNGPDLLSFDELFHEF
jgi:hypothetical protein